MKRLLCVISSMNSGGAETFLMKIYRKLDRTKYQMDFCINVQGECFYSKEIQDLGGRIFYVPPKSKNLKEFKKQFYNLIKAERYNYVLRVASNATGFLDLKIAKAAGAKHCSVRATNSKGSTGLANILQRVGRLLYTKYIDVKIAPSDLAAKYTFGEKSYRNGMVEILHNSVDMDVYRYSGEGRDGVREEFGVDKSRIVIGHIGRFAQQKNHKFLLEVFLEIKKRNKDAVLLLVGGNGELEAQVRQNVLDMGLDSSVIFAGIRKDIPRLLSAMDVFVMPSFFEGMPNTVIEAQATGLPCVISDTITREADITGLVSYLPLNNPEVWAEAALESIKDERADTKQSFVDNEYDIESTVKKFVKLVFGE